MGETQPVLNSSFELIPNNPRWTSSAEQWGGNVSSAIMLWNPQMHTKWDQISVSIIDSCEYKAEKFLALK